MTPTLSVFTFFLSVLQADEHDPTCSEIACVSQLLNCVCVCVCTEWVVVTKLHSRNLWDWAYILQAPQSHLHIVFCGFCMFSALWNYRLLPLYWLKILTPELPLQFIISVPLTSDPFSSLFFYHLDFLSCTPISATHLCDDIWNLLFLMTLSLFKCHFLEHTRYVCWIFYLLISQSINIQM